MASVVLEKAYKKVYERMNKIEDMLEKTNPFSVRATILNDEITGCQLLLTNVKEGLEASRNGNDFSEDRILQDLKQTIEMYTIKVKI